MPIEIMHIMCYYITTVSETRAEYITEVKHMSESTVQTKPREQDRSTGTYNADRLYNSLSDSDKALITAMLNTAFVLLKSVQSVGEKQSAG